MSGVDDDMRRRHARPVLLEHVARRPLEVRGAIPPVLDGMVLRNGPDAAPTGAPGEAATWWGGDGMVHQVELDRATASAYRARRVRTRRLSRGTGSEPVPGPVEPAEGPANAAVVWHAGRLLATDGVGFPYRLTTALDTVCVEDLDSALTSPLCARPRTDPATGALSAYGSDPYGPPFLRYHELDSAGELVHSTDVAVDGPSWQPDFAVTASRVVLFDTPARADPSAGGPAPGGPAPGLPYRWDPHSALGAAVLPRGAQGSTARWAQTAACLPVAVANAFDDDGAVVLDAVVADGLPDVPAECWGGRLERWRLDPGSGTLTRTALDDRAVALATADPAVSGRRHRYVYALEASPDPGVLVRFDTERDESVRFDPGPGRMCGEPLFVRDPDGRSDDEGWLLTFVYDAGEDASELVVLDASRMARPDAAVRLPARVPAGRHGTWVPAELYR